MDLAKTNNLKSYPGLRALPTNGRMVSNFNITNNSSTSLTINQIYQDGTSGTTGIASPGAQNIAVGPVYFGSTFTVTDPNGRLIVVFVASDATVQSFIITQKMVNFWKY